MECGECFGCFRRIEAREGYAFQRSVRGEKRLLVGVDESGFEGAESLAEVKSDEDGLVRLPRDVAGEEEGAIVMA